MICPRWYKWPKWYRRIAGEYFIVAINSLMDNFLNGWKRNRAPGTRIETFFGRKKG